MVFKSKKKNVYVETDTPDKISTRIINPFDETIRKMNSIDFTDFSKEVSCINSY